MKETKQVVYVVQTETNYPNKRVFKNRGVYMTHKQAKKVADSYDSCMTTGYVVEVELNKEYDEI